MQYSIYLVSTLPLYVKAMFHAQVEEQWWLHEFIEVWWILRDKDVCKQKQQKQLIKQGQNSTQDRKKWRE